MKHTATIIALFILCVANVQAQKILKPMWSTAHVGTAAHFNNSGTKLLTYGGYSFDVWDNTTDTLLYTFIGSSPLADVRFNNDDSKIAAVTSNGTVFIVNAETGKKIHELSEGFQGYNSVEFSKAGNLVLTTSGNSTTHIWFVKSGKIATKIYTGENRIIGGKFSNNGLYVLLYYKNGAELFDTGTGESIRSFSHSGTIVTAQFDKYDERILTASQQAGIKLWDMKTGKEIYHLTGLPEIYRAEVSSDGEYFLYTSKINTITVREFSTGIDVRTYKGGDFGPIVQAHFSKSGEYIISTESDGIAKLLCVKSGEPSYIFELSNEYEASYCEFEPSGKRFLTTGRTGVVTIWDTVTKEKVTEHYGYYGAETYPQFSISGKRIIVGSQDFTVKVWNTENGNLELLDYQFVTDRNQLVPSCLNNTFVTSSFDGEKRIRDMDSLGIVYNIPRKYFDFKFLPNCHQIIGRISVPDRFEIYDLEQSSVIMSIPCNESVYQLSNLRISSDGSFLTALKDSAIHIWSLQTGLLLHTVKIKLPSYNFIDFIEFADDNTLIVGTFLPYKMIWMNVEMGKIVREYSSKSSILHTGLIKSKSELIITTREKDIKIYKANTGELLRTININREIYSVDFSADGNVILTAEKNGINLYRSTTMEKIARTIEYEDIFYAKFNETADRIVTSDNDGTIRVWDVSDLMTSINNDEYANNAPDITVSPNPTTDEITIKGINSDLQVAYTFTDILGTVITHGTIPEQTDTYTLSTRNLPSGFYNVTFQMNGTKHTEKLTVVH